MRIPAFVLRQLYVKGSLRAGQDVRFTLLNSLASATLTGVKEVRIGGQAVPPERVTLELGGVAHGHAAPGGLVFPRQAEARVRIAHAAPPGKLEVRIVAESKEFGELAIEFEDEAPG